MGNQEIAVGFDRPAQSGNRRRRNAGFCQFGNRPSIQINGTAGRVVEFDKFIGRCAGPANLDFRDHDMTGGR